MVAKSGNVGGNPGVCGSFLPWITDVVRLDVLISFWYSSSYIWPGF